MNTETNPGPVNIGSDQECELFEVAQMIIDLSKSSSKIVFEPPLPFMRSQVTPDISRAKEALGWFPVVRLEDGLKQMIEYTRGQKNLL